MRLRAIDICAGAGGWACAARDLPIDIVAAVDLEADCLSTYTYNHPNVKTFQCDVRSVDWNDPVFRNIDLILGGIPCEQISNARSNCPPTKEVMDDWKDLLSFCLDLPARLKAEYWCYEDVALIRRFLPEHTPNFVLNSAQFSAQSRKRAYVGNIPSPLSVHQEPDVLGDIVLDEAGPWVIHPKVLTTEEQRQGETCHLYSMDVHRVLNSDWKAPTVTYWRSGKKDRMYLIQLDDGRKRSMTFQEMARLQGFPIDYVFVASPSRAAKMVGQAVQIDTGRAILEELVKVAIREKQSA